MPWRVQEVHDAGNHAGIAQQLAHHLLGKFGFSNVTFSDSDVISVGLVFGHILNFFH